MFDYFPLAIVILTFFIAGSVKGIVGLGLPTISLGLLVMLFDLTSAIVITLLPSLITNLWQAMAGKNGKHVLLLIYPFLFSALVTIWLGAYLLTTQDVGVLTLLLGMLLMAYALISLKGIHFTIPHSHIGKSGLLLGILNGVLTGMAGVFIMPSVIYFNAIGLRRDELVQAMGILFSLSSISMLLAYQKQTLISEDDLLLSLIAVIPALLGMALGQHIRQQLSETRFKKMLFITLLILGVLIIIKAI